MKKVALVFTLAVLVPSLVLAWLAVRSLRDQQFVLERQRSLLYQGVADALARHVEGFLAGEQQEFRHQVDSLLGEREPRAIASSFDDSLRQSWPVARVGFVVTLNGDILAPSPTSSTEARLFCADNGRFLGNREMAEVYWNPKVAYNTLNNAATQSPSYSPNNDFNQNNSSLINDGNRLKSQARNVQPQQQIASANLAQQAEQPISKISTAEAEFRQLIGDQTDGALARFLDNKLNVLFWYRSLRDPSLVFGAQIELKQLVAKLNDWVGQFEPAYRDGLCFAILDDKARPVMLSTPGFQANWKRPFVATEIGETLPHWEAAVYLVDPGELARSARSITFTLGLLILVLVLAIAVGGWLLVRDLNRELTLARQKTDFVSNVSHELKTPLTSIRMFSELLSEGRIHEPEKRRSYLNIISAEAARLTRLINNVLDFSRMERGEKDYRFAACDLAAVARESAGTFRPHLESAGFKFDTTLPDSPVMTRADRDAIAQVIVNLLSNAEKYSNGSKEIALQVGCPTGPVRWAELKVLDRGPGVPRDAEEKVFEKFYRANDSLANAVQGSGLGLTLARQIARAHGGDVIYSRREGSGSCFTLRLPLSSDSVATDVRRL